MSVSSVAQSRFREAMSKSWDKNDPKDASVILEMLKQGRIEFPTPAHIRRLTCSEFVPS